MNDKELISRVLAWCNNKRKEGGLSPLDDLPKGVQNDGLSCPCGAATGLYVGYQYYNTVLKKDRVMELAKEQAEADEFVTPTMDEAVYEVLFGPKEEVPSYVIEFAKRFDQGEFTEYRV